MCEYFVKADPIPYEQRTRTQLCPNPTEYPWPRSSTA